MSEMQVRDFRCNNCGTPLDIPKNSKGKVVCPSCKTECVIEGLVKNSEIQAKENINSGVMLTADPGYLKKRVVEVVSGEPDMPLDALDTMVVTKEEHFCIPAYLYYCNASASFTYEAGNIREHKTAIDRGDYTTVEREQYLEWTQMSSSVSTTATLVASGNRDYGGLISQLYMHLDPSALSDIEELEYPFDVQTEAYNLPQAAAFSEYVKPHIESELEYKAEQSLAGKTYRNISMGGSNVQKDEVIRIFLGFYKVTCEYKGQEFHLYFTGDGKMCIYDELPVDNQRAAALAEMEQRREAARGSVKNNHKWFLIGAIVCAVLGLALNTLLLIPAIGLFVCFFVFKSKYNKKVLTATDPIDQEIAAFKAQPDMVRKQFIERGMPLQGIYNGF